MAKSLLTGFRIGVDVIDRLTTEENGRQSFPFHNSAATTVATESPPAGAEPRDEVTGDDDVSHQEPYTVRNETPLKLPDSPISVEPEAHEPSETVLKCARDGLFHLVAIGEISYRLGGVRSLFVTSLRVNIRATYGEKSYYDSLDLYAAKMRSAFAQAFARVSNAEIGRVERDLVMILEKLEEERDEALRAGTKNQAVEVSAQEKDLGLSLLRDARLFERIVEDMSALGYVGEDLNKQLLYLCASSRKLDDPISVLIVSQSAAGKSFLVETVRKLMPAEDVVAVTSLSDQALNYIDDLSHKFLILGEAVHGEVVEHQIREMLSGKELSRLVTIKDAETGKLQSRMVRTPVIVASVMSGTSQDLNPENASRCFLVNADESRIQTRRIHERQRQKYSLEHLAQGRGTVEAIVRRHQAAQRMLTKRQVVNDFAPLLDFPSNLMRSRRDHDRFLDLIACVCFLRQYQKREEHLNGIGFIRCDLEDYRVAYRIMVEGVLSSTIRELSAGMIGLYDEIRAWVGREAAKQRLRPEEVSFTQRQVREMTGLGHTWVKLALRQLLDFDHLVIAKGGAERTKAFYRLREDASIQTIDLSMIPTPDAMEEKLGEGKE